MVSLNTQQFTTILPSKKPWQWKRKMEKYQFQLIGHEVLIEMDMFSLLEMLKSKNKMLLNPHLLHWANWFSKWNFKVKHIEGITITLLDFMFWNFKSDTFPIISVIYSMNQKILLEFQEVVVNELLPRISIRQD